MANRQKAETKEGQIQQRTAPPGEVVYHAILREGEEELERDSQALAWSGLAAGLSMGFSFLAEGLLQFHIAEARWQPLLTKFGYSLGFLIVILGRQQLFTKNTLTVILPLLKQKKISLLGNVGRLWAVVLATNLIGAFLFAWLLARTPIFDGDLHAVLGQIGRQAMAADFLTALLRSILAGWLIALMVWLLPFAESARVWVIVLLAYIVGVAELPHIIAGSVAVFYLLAAGEASLARCLGRHIAPALLGNIIGGVALVAALAHAEFVGGEQGENV